MVQDHVHDDAEAARARLADEANVARVAAEAVVHAVEIRDCIAVVGTARLVVLLHGRQPELRGPEVREVAEPRAQALEVAAVPPVGIGAVRGFAVARHRVVRRITIRKAVRHREVDRIRTRESLALRGTGRTREEFIRLVEDGLPALAESDVEATWRSAGRDQEVNEEVVRVRRARDAVDGSARIGDGRLERRDALAVHEELQSAVLHAHPPGGGLDAFDAVACGSGRGGNQAEDQRQKPSPHRDAQPRKTNQITATAAASSRLSRTSARRQAGSLCSAGSFSGVFARV